ncbi:MAG: hypothetical protein KJ583_04140 [Nanoarchaeota archaeon]|nr:hypothetical protein [Nanoarchaeota archaeon]MBU1269320.1 hypothetical protein [Nanoarchaeota archaeon]MBU1604483.1 hypothetical protein [Nanoarchaeota archaeon]MBU2443198.1 hypothetical protein [Nanoarchaeota archaeon]
MDRKEIKTSRYVAALFFTITIFLIGLIVGNYISELKLRVVYDLQNDLRTDALSNELLFQLISIDLCKNINMTTYTSEVSKIGTRLTHMESIYGYDAPEVWSLKNYYSLLLIRHWMLSEKANELCKLNTSAVLYFYSNKDCVDCEDQGLVLTNVHKNYPLFNIYSFEVDLQNPSLEFLKEKYNIQKERLPTIVIEEEIFYGFQSKQFLIDYLDLERKLEEDKKKHPEWY